jgi:exosortase A-associated hydrolase 2
VTVGVTGVFVEGPAGALAVVVWAPAQSAPVATALYLPPFGDEMNKSRRMVALQARALAAAGWAVAALDPRGTGDSAGDHAQATWQGWREDALHVWHWLRQHYPPPSLLWGLRLGAHLAADLAGECRVSPAALLLWQPVPSGRTFFQQQLRAGMIRGIGSGEDPREAQSPRARLEAGGIVEIAGYGIHPDLVAGAERADASLPLRTSMPVIVREVTVASPAVASPGIARVAARWRDAGAKVDAEAITGASFWAAQEIAEVPGLVASTTRAVFAHGVEAAAALT